ncbi:MAG: bifunctional UDP-N-acetylmuramoyl-tripeptide:D-alanyl-D-alanine ligase/alanine racemase [Prevotella sp.]|nr:bifunctional UDP-N-acetylmuramoyl-tripeptide:D-alanyl-D-alanine ligase/alanine racemase [Prevotella sp.]
MNYSIEKITTLIGARRYGETESQIAFLLTDSRSLSFAEQTLFFAIKTERNDGHKYIPELYDRGVRNFVVSYLPDDFNVYPDANFLKVNDTVRALQRLAERHREEFNIPVVGITGSNGKTIVKEWLYQMLLPQMMVTRSPRSYNSQIGVPLSVWLINERSKAAIFEAGISKPGEMDALRGIIQPTIGVLTMLGPAHQEFFESMEQKCREKIRLFHDTKAIVYCLDNKLIDSTIASYPYKGEKLTWSKCDTNAAFYVIDVKKSLSDTTICYRYKGLEADYTIPYIDDASIDNSITVAVLALYLGVSSADLKARMAVLQPVAMRLEVKVGQRGCTLINDSYNSDVNSLDIALDFMNRRPDHKGRRRTVILSDIYQSGMQTSDLYHEVNRQLVSRGVEKFIGIGEELTANKDIINIEDKFFFTTTADFLASSVFADLHDEVILIKGARHFEFDKITDLMVQKVHETTLEVNLNAIIDNLNYYRSFIKPDTKLVCMIKADGYGAGAVEIAKTLQDHRVDYLAVAVADEGVTLRNNGITANVMIMNPEMTAFKTMFDYDLEPEVYSFRLLNALIKAARKEGITGWPVHIKLDTGMCRLGFNPDTDMAQLIDILQHQNALMPRSVFSHFVGSDVDGFDEFSRRQFERFDRASRMLQEAFPHKILRHIDNSAGIEHFPERQLDMCRLGLGLYGVNPRTNKIIHNVSSLKTTILQIRNVAKGESIGYSRRTMLERDSRIAAIPIGYADGLDRHLGNRAGYCLVNGEKAPYMGNICMDVAMIDVTDIDCQEGDRVEIFGDNLPVTVLSDLLGTIPYEILTGISNRVKRVYFQD